MIRDGAQILRRYRDGELVERRYRDEAVLLGSTPLDPDSDPDGPLPPPGGDGMPAPPDSSGWPTYTVPVGGGTITPANVGGSPNIRLLWPEATVSGNLVEIKNFRNVHSIGGYVEVVKATAMANSGGIVYLQDCFEDGVYYFEGLHIDSKGWISDTFRYQGVGGLSRGGRCYVYFVNCRFDNVEYGAGAGFHGDLIQITAANHEVPACVLNLYNFTGRCTGQGFMFGDRTLSGNVKGDPDKQLAANQAGLITERTNLRVIAGLPAEDVYNRHKDRGSGPAPSSPSEVIKGGLKLFWLGHKTGGGNFTNHWYSCTFGPDTYLSSDVNSKDAAALCRPSTGSRGEAVWKGTAGPGRAVKDAQGNLTWPNSVANGVVYSGTVLDSAPPGGDWAPASLLYPSKVYDRADWS